MDSTLIKIGEGIIGKALDPNTRGAAEVVSEGEDTKVSKSKDYHHGYFSKGIDDESVACLLSLKPNQKKKSACMTVLSSRTKVKSCAAYFWALHWKSKNRLLTFSEKK